MLKQDNRYVACDLVSTIIRCNHSESSRQERYQKYCQGQVVVDVVTIKNHENKNDKTNRFVINPLY
jgi:hypothetical protein